MFLNIGEVLERLSIPTSSHTRFLKKENPSIFATVETQKLKRSHIPDLPGYQKIVLDANPARGAKRGRPSGGVCVYIKNELSKNFEFCKSRRADSVVWFRIPLPEKWLFVCFCYAKICDSKFCENLSNDILDFSKTGEVILFGDFNARLGELVGDKKCNAQKADFLALLEFHDLSLVNKSHAFGGPTSISPTFKNVKKGSNSIIDLCCVSNPEQIQTFRVDDTVFGSSMHASHRALVCELKGNVSAQSLPPPKTTPKPSFNHITDENIEHYTEILCQELPKIVPILNKHLNKVPEVNSSTVKSACEDFLNCLDGVKKKCLGNPPSHKNHSSRTSYAARAQNELQKCEELEKITLEVSQINQKLGEPHCANRPKLLENAAVLKKRSHLS